VEDDFLVSGSTSASVVSISTLLSTSFSFLVFIALDILSALGGKLPLPFNSQYSSTS